MTVSRKFFSETVTITGPGATSVMSLLSAAGWGFEPGANNAIGSTTLSLDSINGVALTIIPESAQIFVGHDQYVSNTVSAGPPRTYRGVPVAATVPYSLGPETWGIVDPNAVWIFNPTSAQSLDLIFEAI